MPDTHPLVEDLKIAFRHLEEAGMLDDVALAYLTLAPKRAVRPAPSRMWISPSF